MKRNLLLILIIAIIVILAALSVVFVCVIGLGDKQSSYETDMFSFNNTEEISGYCENNRLKYLKEDGIAYVYDIPCYGEKVQFIYTLEDEKVQLTTAYVLLFGYEEDDPYVPVTYTESKLNIKIHSVLENLCNNHGVSLDENFFIFSGENSLNTTENSSYKQIMDGTAAVEFCLKDAEDRYWKVRSQKMDDGVVYIIVEKFYDDALHLELIPNIEVE